MKDAIQIPCDPQPEDWGYQCPTCQVKVGRAWRPLSVCGQCGRPWVVLDAHGKRTNETYPAVYDLAEFERQLELRLASLQSIGPYEDIRPVKHVLEALRKSKRP